MEVYKPVREVLEQLTKHFGKTVLKHKLDYAIRELGICKDLHHFGGQRAFSKNDVDALISHFESRRSI